MAQSETLAPPAAPSAPVRTKPRLRGVSHEIAAGIAAGAGAVLVATSHSSRAATAAAIYAVSLVALYVISAAYHRPTWTPAKRQWMRRLDHAAIFLLIAGTATPIAVLSLGDAGVTLMWRLWVGAFAGVAQAMFWVRAPKILVTGIYLALSWMTAPYLPQFYEGIGLGGVWLLVGGAICYTVGAVIYALKWPDPAPSTFGYHEIFHLLVIVASVCHFILILRLLQGPLGA